MSKRSGSSVVRAASVSGAKQAGSSNLSPITTSMAWSPGMTLEEVKRQAVITCLDYHLWNKTHAANHLGVSIRALRNWLDKWGLSGLNN